MPGNETPRFTEMGRIRGRRYQTASFTLTPEQIKYLDTVDNPSELVRTLLYRHMQQAKEEKWVIVSAYASSSQLWLLQSQLQRLLRERRRELATVSCQPAG